MNPDVMAKLNLVNEGVKCKFVSETKVNVIRTRQKRQCKMGCFEAMQYFDRKNNKNLTWFVLVFDDEKH
jgi:hypothetical protein